MLNIHFSRLLCLTLALQFVFPANVFATDPAQQRREIVEKTRELFSQPATQDVEFKDANKRALSREAFLTQPPTEFYMLPSGQLNGAPYALRVKSEQSANGDFVVAIAVMDQALQNTFSRRAITMGASQSAAQRLVNIERAVNTMVQSIQTASVKGKAKTRTVASAGDDVAVKMRRVLYAAYCAGIIGAAIGYFEYLPEGVNASRVMWGGFALLAASAAIHYIAFGDSVENN